jgi:ribose transport system substrate-binding protein
MKALMRWGLSAVLPLAALTLAGCGGSRHASDEKYYLIAANISIPYWQSATSGFLRAAREFGVTAEVSGPKTYDPAAQHNEFQRVLGKKPTGILVSPADPKLLEADIAAAIAAGIPVVTVDSDAPSSKRLFFVGTNNHEAGRLGGRELVKRLGGKGNVVVLTMPNQANLAERLRGYRDVVGENSGIKITKVIDIRGDSRVAFDSVKELLDKKEPVDAFVCLEALGGKEVADVLTREKVTNKILVAMDTDKDTLDWIQKGVIQVAIAQKPFTMGYYGLQALDDAAHNKVSPLDKNWALDPFSKLPVFVDTGLTVVDKNNVGEFLQAQESSSK